MLRPFTPAGTAWVHEVSLDPDVQQYVKLPSPYRREHAGFLVEARLRKRLRHRGTLVEAWVGSVLGAEAGAS